MAVDGTSIVNLGDLTKPATVLIEKISDAIGVLYEPRKIRKKAEAEAEAEKIKAIATIELTEIQQRAMTRLINQEAIKQENIENITAQAVNLLPAHADSEGLDKDWIAHFFSKCELVSDQEMQSLWANLLSSEATAPGTYSKRTIDLIATMDKNDAELFTKLAQFCWVIAEPTPLIWDYESQIYTHHGITFSGLKHLDAIGLISFDSNNGYLRNGLGKHVDISYFDNRTIANFTQESDNKIILGKVILTQAGKQLFSICGAEKNQKFYEYSADEIKKQGITLTHIVIG